MFTVNIIDVPLVKTSDHRLCFFLNKNVFYKFGEMWIVEKNMSFVNT